MNEQLVVKNFGPIKDATVDFKRVTVFIGPTGGGKSTLAKLVAVFRDGALNTFDVKKRKRVFDEFSLEKFFHHESSFEWKNEGIEFIMHSDLVLSTDKKSPSEADRKIGKGIRDVIQSALDALSPEEMESILNSLKVLTGTTEVSDSDIENGKPKSLLRYQVDVKLPTTYFPSNRSFISAIEYSWAGLLRDDIGLPKDTLEFANDFSLSRKNVPELDIPFLNVKYIHRNGQDFIKIPESETLFRLYETASGIQSVTPLLVLLEHLSRNTEQAQSFIIEEPELNLFPTAQFELVKILVDKCARLEGKNDLVLTTHSPYVLTALNLMCYAFRIAQQDEATAKKVAKLIPRHCWIDPEQFAAYYVDRPDTKRKQQVRSIINKKTGLIEENELDTASEALSNIFDKLMDLRQPVKSVARAK